MRDRLFAAALLGTTMMTSPAHAMPPVIGLIGTAATAVVGGVNTAFLAVGGAVGLSVPASLGLAAGFGNLVVGLGLNAVSNALLGGSSPDRYTPQQTQTQVQRLVNFAQPITPMQTIYGTTRVGGPVVFTGFANNRRYYTVAVAAHPTGGPVTHYLDERVVTLDGSNVVNTAPMTGYGKIVPFTGSNGYNAEFAAALTEYTTDQDFAGLSGAHLWASRPPGQNFPDIYPRGREWAYLPVWQGHIGIYDPRDESTGYSNNAALVIAHWIVNYLEKTVDWDEVAIEADVCDETVTNRAGETQARWTVNGVLNDAEDFETQRARLLGACAGYLYEMPGGKVGFRVGRWIAPTLTLTDDDLLELSIEEGQAGKSAPTELQIRYVEPAQAWREVPIVWSIDDTAARRRDDVPMDMVTNVNQGSRLAKIISKRRRPQHRLNARLKLIGYEVIGHRYITINSAALGKTITVEVDRLVRDETGLSFQLEAVSALASDWTFNAATEEIIPPITESVAGDTGIEAPTGVSASSGGNGTILVDWTAAHVSLSQQVRLTLDGTSVVYDIPYGQKPAPISGLVDGGVYTVEVRNKSPAFRVSDWVTVAGTVTAVSNPTAPAAHDAVDATLDGSDVDLTWTAPNDPNYAAARIYRATDSTTFGDASLIHTEYGPPSSADAYTDTAPGTGADFSYWFEPINGSGVAGTKSGPETVTIP